MGKRRLENGGNDATLNLARLAVVKLNR
jgi:hypothetical protein